MKEKIFAFVLMVMMVVPSSLASVPEPFPEPLCIEKVIDGQGNEGVELSLRRECLSSLSVSCCIQA